MVGIWVSSLISLGPWVSNLINRGLMNAEFDQIWAHECCTWSVLGYECRNQLWPYECQTWRIWGLQVPHVNNLSLYVLNLINLAPMSLGPKSGKPGQSWVDGYRTSPMLNLWVPNLPDLGLWVLNVINLGPMSIELTNLRTMSVELHQALTYELDQSWAYELQLDQLYAYERRTWLSLGLWVSS